MPDRPADDGPQHGDTDSPVSTSNADELDSPEFHRTLTSVIDRVRSGDALGGDHDDSSSDQNAEGNRASSRGPDDSSSDTDADGEDATDGYHVTDWDDGESRVDLGADADENDDGGDGDDDGGDRRDADSNDDGEDDDGDIDAAGDSEDDGHDDDEGVGDTLTEKDRKAIREDPRLRKLQRSLNRDYTQKTQELANLRREVRAERAQNRELVDTLSTPQGMANYMQNVMEVRPDIGAAAFGGALTGEEQVELLTEIGLEHPKAMDSAIETLETLRGDKGAMRNHQIQRKLKMERQQVQVERMQLAARRENRQMARLEGQLETELRRKRIPKGEWEDISKTFKRAAKKQVRKDGSIDYSTADIEALVGREKEKLDRVYKRAKVWHTRQGVKQGQRDAKDLAGRNKNRRGRSSPRSSKPSKPTKGRGNARGPQSLADAVKGAWDELHPRA